MVTTRNMIIAVSFVLLFLLLNFEPGMASIFMFVILVGAFVHSTDKKPVIVFEKPGNNRLKSVGLAMIGYVAFMGVSMVVLSFLKLIDVQSISATMDIYSQWIGSLMAQFSPALADNKILVLISWGILIPIAETFAFFMAMFEWFTEIFKTRLHLNEVKVWMIMMIVAGIFTLFHVTAKGLGNNPGLIMTFLFGLVSVVLVLYTGQVLDAIILHVVTNSTAIILSTGLLSSLISPFFIIGVMLIIIYFVIRNMRLKFLWGVG